MGSDLIIVVFAVVVIGGMGSIMGAIVTGFGARRDRGPDQGVLPGSLQHRDLRHHGDRAADPAGRPVRTEGLTWQRVDRHRRRARRSRRAAGARPIAFVVMVAVLVVAPFFVYPMFLMQALCFALFACAFNLLIGYVGLLSFGHALYFGWASYLAAHSAKVWGFPPELAILTGTLTGGGARPRGRLARDPPAGHLFRHDHAGAGADDVLLRAAGEVHRRRGRHPGGAARQAVRPDRSRRPDQRCMSSCWRSSSPASC